MPEKHPKDMTVEELIADVKTLPNTERSILSHNERVLIELAQALAAKLAGHPAEVTRLQALVTASEQQRYRVCSALALQVDRMRGALHSLRGAIMEAAKGEDAVISCTFWMPGIGAPTAVDFIDMELEAVDPALPVVRHLKRGSTYDVIGEGTVQVSVNGARLPFALGTVKQREVIDGVSTLVAYRDHDTGKLYFRFPDEINDPARFEKVEP